MLDGGSNEFILERYKYPSEIRAEQNVFSCLTLFQTLATIVGSSIAILSAGEA